jgi:hypothetical protein
LALLALAVPALTGAAGPLPVVDPTTPAARDTEPVILTGRDFAPWSTRANQTVKAPLVDLAECSEAPQLDPQNPNASPSSRDRCPHNHYAEPEVDSSRAPIPPGTPVDRLLGYRWDAEAKAWKQIPFQVDEQFTRYLDNSASGFALYSGQDEHTTYAYNREGFRYTRNDPANPCLARPASTPQPDPVKGLDDNDELVFMASDAGPQAPADAPLPPGIEDARQVLVSDPSNPAARSYAYVMKAAENGPRPSFDASNGYVSYARDPNADLFERSVSSYSSYGNAAKGPYCDRDGNVVMNPKTGEPDVDRRRPRDYATVTTPRYRFRYDGRWLMTQINIKGPGDTSYGPDVVDRWKARAFQQDPGSKTPCCGFEEEDTNWGGSSTLLGERVGPVRAIRETWGADSGTNVIRRETFYREEVRQASFLRVHVIPPLDGIYAQWDFNAGVMTRFYNARHPEGVEVDGRNDEAFGNLDDPCNSNYRATDPVDGQYRTLYGQLQLCRLPYHQSVDMFDPTFSDANAALSWSETAGPSGTIVDRYSARLENLSPAGAAQSVVAVPYYRDDSCFDDGTGTDPGPKVRVGSGDEPRTYGDPPRPRKCWEPSDGRPSPSGDPQFFQGSIGTHAARAAAAEPVA